MKSSRSIAFLLVSTLGVAGWAHDAPAKPVAISVVAVVSPSLGAEDFLSPMVCAPAKPCAMVSPASSLATRPAVLPKAGMAD